MNSPKLDLVRCKQQCNLRKNRAFKNKSQIVLNKSFAGPIKATPKMITFKCNLSLLPRKMDKIKHVSKQTTTHEQFYPID